jgi:acetyl esterase/lipase
VVEGYAALEYLVGNADFGVDQDRIGVMEESAGGGLAACLVHWTMVSGLLWAIIGQGQFQLRLAILSRSDHG